MSVDLVYKVGSISHDNYKELRYSIRSCKRHFKDLNNIYIVGTKPNWLENVKHIKLDDCYTHNKDANLINKLIIACFDKEITKNFLNMSDDYFMLQDLRKEDFMKAMYDDKVIAVMNTPGKKLTKWELRLQRTLHTLSGKGLPIHCYETHCPQMIDRDVYPGVVMNYDYGEANGMCGNTLYFNTIKAESKQLDENSLIRLETKLLNLKDLEALITSKKQLMNYTVNSYNAVLEQYLATRFPESTCYEAF